MGFNKVSGSKPQNEKANFYPDLEKPKPVNLDKSTDALTEKGKYKWEDNSDMDSAKTKPC